MAVSMFFLGIVLVGLIASQRMSVELFPSITGDTIFVNFQRPGSDPEVIERDMGESRPSFYISKGVNTRGAGL